MQIARSRLRGGSHSEREREVTRGIRSKGTTAEWNGMGRGQFALNCRIGRVSASRENCSSRGSSVALRPRLLGRDGAGKRKLDTYLHMCRCALRDSSHVSFRDSYAEDACDDLSISSWERLDSFSKRLSGLSRLRDHGVQWATSRASAIKLNEWRKYSSVKSRS